MIDKKKNNWVIEEALSLTNYCFYYFVLPEYQLEKFCPE